MLDSNAKISCCIQMECPPGDAVLSDGHMNLNAAGGSGLAGSLYLVAFIGLQPAGAERMASCVLSPWGHSQAQAAALELHLLAA